MFDAIERGRWKKPDERRQALHDLLMEAEESGT